MADIFLTTFSNAFSWMKMYEFLLKFCKNSFIGIGTDTNIEVIVVSLTTWEAHHSPSSNHCDITVRLVTPYSNCALNQNRLQNTHYHSWENRSKFDKMIFWKYKLFTMVKLHHPKHTSVLLDICQQYIDSRLFPRAFSKLGLKLNNGTFQIINHLTNSNVPHNC